MHGGPNWNGPTAIKCTMSHKKTSFSTEMFAGAIISRVQYLAPRWYTEQGWGGGETSDVLRYAAMFTLYFDHLLLIGINQSYFMDG
jgi:hypothetical protein